MTSNNSSRYSNHSLHSNDHHHHDNSSHAFTTTTSTTSTALYHRFDDLPSTASHNSDVSSRYISAPPSVSASASVSGAGGDGESSDRRSGARMLGRSLSSGNAHMPTPYPHQSQHPNNDNDDYDNTNHVSNGSTARDNAHIRVTVGSGSGGGAAAAVIPSKRHQPYDTRTLPGVGVLHVPTPSNARVAATTGGGNGMNGRRGQSKTVLARSTTTPAGQQSFGVRPLVIPTPPSIAGTTASSSTTAISGGIAGGGNRVSGRSRAGSHSANQAGSGLGDSFADYREETIVASNPHYHNRTVSALTTIASRIMFTGWYTALYLLMCLLCLFLLVWKLVNHLCIGDLPCLDEDEESDVYAALDIATTAMLLFEVSIRILATRKTFFKSWFNLFDFVVLLASIGSFVVYVSGVRFGDSITKSIILFVRYSIQLCRLILVFKRHRDRIRIMSLASHAPVDFTAIPSDMVVDSVTYENDNTDVVTMGNDGTAAGYIGTGSPITAALLAQGRTPPPALLYGRPHQRIDNDDDDFDDINHSNNDMPDPPPKHKPRGNGH